MEDIRMVLCTNKLRFRGRPVSREDDVRHSDAPKGFSTLSTGTNSERHSYVMELLEDWGMNLEVNENAIDEIVASCNGDIRGALKALMLVNEHLEAELQQLHAAVAHRAGVERGSSALH
jgi:hypothetical protein